MSFSFNNRFEYKNEVKEWDEDRWINRITIIGKKIQNIDKCRFEDDKIKRRKIYYEDTHTLYSLPLVIACKDIYDKHNQFRGYQYAIDIFDGLYGHYPTKDDIDEVLRLKGQVDTYIHNKKPYDIGDKRVNKFYKKMNKYNNKIKIEEENKKIDIGSEEINELDIETLKLINKHIDNLINTEDISEEKAFTLCKLISFSANKTYKEKYGLNKTKETVKELQTE